MVKWESTHTECGPGLRPYTFQKYPIWMSKAGRVKGVPGIVEERAAADEVEEANLLSRGFRAGQDVALAYLHASDQDVAVLAAERAFHDRRMSAKAQAEAAAIDERTSSHLAAIPEQPRKPRGRPVKKKTAKPSEEPT
jgi:hypothetical protein